MNSNFLDRLKCSRCDWKIDVPYKENGQIDLPILGLSFAFAPLSASLNSLPLTIINLLFSTLIVGRGNGFAIGFLNFWLFSILIDLMIQERPTSFGFQPNCYLATVAARGNPKITGSEIVHLNGVPTPVSKQLRTFKAAELTLKKQAPELHKSIRNTYDRVGPPAAAKIGTQGATLLHLAFTPLQMLTYAGLHLFNENPKKLVESCYPRS